MVKKLVMGEWAMNTYQAEIISSYELELNCGTIHIYRDKIWISGHNYDDPPEFTFEEWLQYADSITEKVREMQKQKE